MRYYATLTGDGRRRNWKEIFSNLPANAAKMAVDRYAQEAIPGEEIRLVMLKENETVDSLNERAYHRRTMLGGDKKSTWEFVDPYQDAATACS